MYLRVNYIRIPLRTRYCSWSIFEYRGHGHLHRRIQIKAQLRAPKKITLRRTETDKRPRTYIRSSAAAQSHKIQEKLFKRHKIGHLLFYDYTYIIIRETSLIKEIISRARHAEILFFKVRVTLLITLLFTAPYIFQNLYQNQKT